MNEIVKFSTKKNRKRKGRGISAGQGKTAGRGTKGQNARSGVSLRPSFEGGQTPMIQKLPKIKGFNSPHAAKQEVKVGSLSKVSGKVVTPATLHEAGLVKDPRGPVKVIGGGELSAAKTVEVDAVSKGAVSTIKKAGGKVTLKAVHVHDK